MTRISHTTYHSFAIPKKSGQLFPQPVITFVILLAFILTNHLAIAQGPGTGWNFSRNLSLNTPTTIANYQVKVTLTTALMGSPYTNVNADGSDLRFYDSRNNLCVFCCGG
ncbi:MAG: hypothetical protein EOO13_17310 [Chitinophagaceae bacterium]|nr:MAG: hypothetical protein EOO13_17310 [Chitinophagaceae bacterium]